MISILDRYLVKAVIGGVLMVMLVLLALSGFINFVAETDKIGTGDFQLFDAFMYVLLRMPRQAFGLLPVTALLGALFGLGALASSSELIVMRASGISVARMARSVAIAGFLLMIAAAGLSELIAPPAEQFARSERARLLNQQISIAGNASTWVKDENAIVNVREFTDNESAGGVFLFSFDEGHRLTSVGRAASARIDTRQRWLLQDFRETRFDTEGVQTASEALAVRSSSLNPDVLNLSVMDPERLASAGLFRYISYLRANSLETRRYEVALWARLADISTVLIMTLLALPFVFGSQRKAGAGQRLLIGVILGVAYLLGSRMMLNSGEVFGLNPFLTAWAPTLVLAVVTGIALSRVR
jgi:lipopolysaccharide export system permease protein